MQRREVNLNRLHIEVAQTVVDVRSEMFRGEERERPNGQTSRTWPHTPSGPTKPRREDHIFLSSQNLRARIKRRKKWCQLPVLRVKGQVLHHKYERKVRHTQNSPRWIKRPPYPRVLRYISDPRTGDEEEPDTRNFILRIPFHVSQLKVCNRTETQSGGMNRTWSEYDGKFMCSERLCEE